MAIRKYMTRYGVVYHSSTCKDDHRNIETSRQYIKESGSDPKRPRKGADVTLQRSALKSFKVAEAKADQEIVITGSIRTCAAQMAYWLSDKDRYANPDSTLHTQGLAIDVSTDYLNAKIKKALKDCGWNQSRPDDEPWHFSFKLTA